MKSSKQVTRLVVEDYAGHKDCNVIRNVINNFFVSIEALFFVFTQNILVANKLLQHSKHKHNEFSLKKLFLRSIKCLFFVKKKKRREEKIKQ